MLAMMEGPLKNNETMGGRSRCILGGISLILFSLGSTQLFAPYGSGSVASRQLRRALKSVSAVTDGGCSTRPTLHETNPTYVAQYDKTMGAFIDGKKASKTLFDEIPTIRGMHTLEAQQFNAVLGWKPRLYVLADGAKFFRRNGSQASAWDKKSVVTANALPSADVSGTVWVHPDTPEQGLDVSKLPVRTVHGNHVTFTSWFQGNYGHYLHDHLPLIAWLRERVDPDTKFLFFENDRDRASLEFIDPDFVSKRVVWIKPFEIIEVHDGTLTVLAASVPSRTLRPIEALGRWLHLSHPPKATYASKQPQLPAPSAPASAPQQAKEEKTIIYYTRGGSGDTMHGRVVETQHEADILATIRRAMTKYGRTERLVIFNGQHDGKTMSVPMQFDLFRSATTAIGPHGSGLANVLWMDPSSMSPSSSCSNRPQILEFLLGPDSIQVHPSGPSTAAEAFARSYYYLYTTIPWVDYHHILYAKNSTEATTYINLRNLELALDAMWGQNGNVDQGQQSQDVSPRMGAAPAVVATTAVA